MAIPYGATKAAVLSVTRALAAGYAKDHLQCFAVCPWTTDTPMIDRLVQEQANPEAVKAGFATVNPSGKLATPTDTTTARARCTPPRRLPCTCTPSCWPWQHRGYLRRLTNGWYYFAQVPVTEPLLWWAAGRLVQPSYLSLETALSYYGLITEGVYTLTSISTRKTLAATTALGSFSYRHLKPALYFGYEALRPADRPLLLATLERALLDYCYLHPRLTQPADFAALRLNAEVLHTRLDHERLRTFQQLFHHTRLDQRLRTLLRTYDCHA